MVLRRVELMGFKSFPDKTSIEFGPGISAIVGPNGSGKSNIADAIRWVLGEVSARALRGQRMEDVIFGGSTGRRPVPLAEVTLTLDNADGTLPVPFAEVSVTRRVDRSGAGDYLINRTPCRLRDVQDLFAGTGLGRNAYAIIGQGEVDELLRARPAERRAMVEEAAGVTRYRQRLHEGGRRLGSAAACAQRLGDLLAERQRALGALSRQAEQAERHARIAAELRAVELRVWAREWQAVERERRAAAGTAEASAQELEALTDELATVASEQRDLAGALAQARAAAEAQGEAAQRAERLLDRARQEVALAVGLGAAAAQEGARAEARAAELRARADRQAADSAMAEAARAEAAERLAAAREGAQAAVRALEAAETERRAAGDAYAGAQAALAQCRQEVAAAAGSGAAETLAAARAALTAADQRRSAAAAAAERAAQALGGAQPAVGPAEGALGAAARDAAELRRHRDAVAALAGRLAGRVQALAEMAASGAGYAQGPRTALEGRRKGVPAFAGVIGALGDLIEVPAHLAAAISAALGGAVQDVVTESADAAERAIAGLKAAHGGRATFLPLGQLRTAPLPADLRGLAERPGALGWAADLVTSEARVRPAVEYALGRVLVAQDLAAARRLGQQAGFRVRIVAVEGEVIHPGGAMSGGSTRGERPGGLLGRDQERRRLQLRLDALQADLGCLEAALRRHAELVGQAERALGEARRAAAAAEAELRAARQVLTAADRERQRLAAEEQAVQQRLRRRGQADPRELQEREKLMAGACEAAAARLAAAEREEARAREAATAARIALATCEQALRTAEAEAGRASREAADVQDRLGRAHEDRTRALETARAQERAAAEASARTAEAEAEVRQAQTRLEAARTRVAEVQREAEQAAARREWADRERERVGGELRRAEAALAKAEAASAALAARLETAYGLPPDALAGVAPSERPGPDRERAAALRRELAALGGVRPEAVGEYRAEAAAVTALSAEAEDVRAARDALEAWGRDIEAALADRYEETLAAVRRHFAAIYARLCGGAADLIPVAPPPEAPGAAAPRAGPDDGRRAGAQGGLPAEAGSGGAAVPSPAAVRPAAAAGLEVVAQPPGKRLAHLGLLSGGERALVAIALVLAFLRVRPTAFCVLDEIEAALDESNVGRCAGYLREIAESTQVIVVTHQKGTMEVAERLIGVTMGDPGVSRLLSVRLAG